VACALGSFNCDRLRDRDSAEAAGIKRADLTIDGGLGNRASVGLAGGGAAARVDVVADTRTPGSRRLRLSHGNNRQGENGNGQNVKREAKLTHLHLSFLGLSLIAVISSFFGS